jgi:hypothetical protein
VAREVCGIGRFGRASDRDTSYGTTAVRLSASCRSNSVLVAYVLAADYFSSSNRTVSRVTVPTIARLFGLSLSSVS